MDRERKVNANCANAGNPFHLCSDHCGQRSSQPHPKPRIVGGGRTPGPDRDGIRVAGRSADPNCVNASNPFHQCAEYCAKRTSDSKKPSSGRFAIPVRGKPSPKSHSDRRDGARSVVGGGSVGIEGRSVDPNCANAGNPFHQCGDHCANKSKDARKQIGTAKTFQNGELRKEEVRKKEEGRKVDPMRVDASNPFHQTTEDSSQRTPAATRHTNGHTSVQNGKLRKEEVRKKEERRKVDPMCVDASNPLHKCTEDCSQRTPAATRRSNGHTSEIVPEPPEIVPQE